MSKVVVNANLTLDGVMQAPSDHDEDRRGGFEHGGCASYARASSHGARLAVALRLVHHGPATRGEGSPRDEG